MKWIYYATCILGILSTGISKMTKYPISNLNGIYYHLSSNYFQNNDCFMIIFDQVSSNKLFYSIHSNHFHAKGTFHQTDEIDQDHNCFRTRIKKMNHTLLENHYQQNDNDYIFCFYAIFGIPDLVIMTPSNNSQNISIISQKPFHYIQKEYEISINNSLAYYGMEGISSVKKETDPHDCYHYMQYYS